jgi:trimethylamine--corrinoid protein Co-methyltransferase
MVICDEFINYIKRFMQGLEVSDETLALDLIHEVGHSTGDFLSTEHTMRHFRDDWYPRLFDRDNFEGWAAAGSKTLRQKAKERVEEILAEHEPEPLPTELQRRIDAIVEGTTRTP